MNERDLEELTIAEVSARVRAGEISPVELTEATYRIGSFAELLQLPFLAEAGA